MNVELISITKGSGKLEGSSSEDIISFVARVSNPDNQKNFSTSSKLLAYLIQNKHWSPFEHSFMTVEITTSRAIAQQILRHRSFTFQEFSQRYSKSLKYIKYEARRQDVKNRQNSVNDMSKEDKIWFDNVQEDVWKMSYHLYEKSLQKGIAKEQARFVLPLNTETTLYMTGSLRSWIHYIELRCNNGTQKEHSDIANQCKKICIECYPNVSKALDWVI